MRIDDRVRQIVDEELRASGVTWRSWLHPCLHGARHGIVKSYGGSEFANAGIVFELCLNLRGKCMHHTKPLVPHLYIRRRLNIWTRIAALDPPVNGSLLLASEATLMKGNLREELEDEDEASALSRQLATPSSTASLRLGSPSSTTSVRTFNTLSRSSSVSSALSSQRGRLGRPPKPICDVLVYVYIPGRHNPLLIDAKGTPRDEVVEFCFSQPAIIAALQILPAEAHKVVYTMWHHNAQSWSPYPKAHQRVFLAPGERVLYRDMYLATTPNLEHYKALLLPPAGQPDTRPRIPAIPPPYASRRATRSGAPAEPQSMPGTPNVRSVLDLLPFAFEDLDEAVGKSRIRSLAPGDSSKIRKRSPSPLERAIVGQPRIRSHAPGDSSKIRKRSPSPLERASMRKRQRNDDTTGIGNHSQGAEAGPSSAGSSSSLPQRGRSRRHGQGKGKGKACAESDVIVLSD
ncbi:hypothetical protein C2E23DRAFT_856768 [Lenzites betulinus]|nr:hypothetical protein C2E23DRAFT_857617 [Lenzites betulinus]KAH9857332.1 hypothetical protein C2E23DRAFT_856768 [Lenzites betulinus]